MLTEKKMDTFFQVRPPVGTAEGCRHPRLAYVASPSKRVKDEGGDRIERHTDPRTNKMIWRKKRKTEVVFISPLRCVRPFKKKKHPWNKNRGFRGGGNQQRQRKTEKKTEKKKKEKNNFSLVKAAVAIFPLPTKYSQMFVKLRIYCCFTAYY